MLKPKTLIVLGREYSVSYVSKPSDVDPKGRDSLWGHIDYWTRRINIYDNGRADFDILETLLHEILHALDNDLDLKLKDGDSEERLHRLAVGLADTLQRNGFWKLK